MRTKAEIITLLTNPGIVAVVRALSQEQVLPLSEALIAGGVVAIEITTSTPNAIAAIREAKQKLGNRALIGVGTVMDVATCQAALDAGAEFVVSPIMRPELVAPCRAADKPIMLGAYTPTEAQLAHEAGSDFVKIFPSDTLGPGYIKAIRAPLPHLRIIPTGIAKVEDITAFIKAGCVGVGLGSLLVPQAVMRDGNWAELTRLAREYVAIVQKART